MLDNTPRPFDTPLGWSVWRTKLRGEVGTGRQRGVRYRLTATEPSFRLEVPWSTSVEMAMLRFPIGRRIC
jgi:hypothetical protein